MEFSSRPVMRNFSSLSKSLKKCTWCAAVMPGQRLRYIEYHIVADSALLELREYPATHQSRGSTLSMGLSAPMEKLTFFSVRMMSFSSSFSGPE